MSKTPFEIRLELLKMSKEMLEQEYYSKKEKITNDWQMRLDWEREQGREPSAHPAVPDFPTEFQIMEKAKALNEFISNG